MYCAGNMPDHVTRYNHKDQSRWLTPPRVPYTRDLRGLVDGIVYAVCGCGLIVTAVFLLQGVGL